MHSEYTPAEIDRFWSRVDRSQGPDACWPWIGSHTTAGYGNLWIREHWIYAHRLAYFLSHGPIPAGHSICHACDNPPCCNPRHLFSGTTRQNHADMRQKGRGFVPEARVAQSNPNSRLSAADVWSIRERHARGGVSMTQLAAEHCVSIETVSRVIRRVIYKHV